jgi:hypothetical protein
MDTGGNIMLTATLGGIMKKDKALSYGFVDLGGKDFRSTAEGRPVLDATDGRIGELPVGPSITDAIPLYAATMQVLELWIEDLPNAPFIKNKGVLRLAGRTRADADPNMHIDAAVDLDFTVNDRRRASVAFEMGFANLMFRNRLDLGFELIELDSDPKDKYQQIKNSIDTESGRQLLDVLNGVPYVQLATRIADGLIQAFGKNESDLVFDGDPVFAIHPAPGAPFLRSGIYIAYENAEDDLPPTQLWYRDRRVERAGEDKRLDRNYLVFSMLIEPAPDRVAKLLDA